MIVVGARPNYPKIAGLMRHFPSATLVHTGQHWHSNMCFSLLMELRIRPTHWLRVEHSDIPRLAEPLYDLAKWQRPSLMIAVGDVNSALATAIVAKRLGCRLAHIESGLRSNDLTMPEEANRIAIDHMSDICFATTAGAADTLLREGVASDAIHFVGNTMIDPIVNRVPQLQPVNISSPYFYVTLHRPALIDCEEAFHNVCAILKTLWLPIIWPRHPRQKYESGLPQKDPVGYYESLALCKFAKAVITDSGGLQEEAAYFGTPCFTVRNNTERPITLAYGNQLVGQDAHNLPRLLLSHNYVNQLPRSPIPLWDGKATERIANIINTKL